jgi:hypothetical protein
VIFHSALHLKAQLLLLPPPPPLPPKLLSKSSAPLPLSPRHDQMLQWMQCLLRSKRMLMFLPMPPPLLLLLPMRRVRAVTASAVLSSVSDRSYSRNFPPRTPRRLQPTQVALGA